MAKDSKTPEAYIIKFDQAPGINGLNRAVTFVNGHGVLDPKGVAGTHPWLFDQQTLKPLVGWDVLGELARYWADRGATVTPCSEKEATAYSAKLHANPTGHLKKPKADKVKTVKLKDTVTASADMGKTPPHQKPKAK